MILYFVFSLTYFQLFKNIFWNLEQGWNCGYVGFNWMVFLFDRYTELLNLDGFFSFIVSCFYFFIVTLGSFYGFLISFLYAFFVNFYCDCFGQQAFIWIFIYFSWITYRNYRIFSYSYGFFMLHSENKGYFVKFLCNV